mgnify:CR=1 FL=1
MYSTTATNTIHISKALAVKEFSIAEEINRSSRSTMEDGCYFLWKTRLI